MPKRRKPPESDRPSVGRKPRRKSEDAVPRAILGRELQRQIEIFELSREQAAKVVGDAASQMSRLMQGHFHEFSADRLIRFLLKLGTDVTITLTHPRRRGKQGRIKIKFS